MAFDLDIVQKEAVALLNLSTRDTDSNAVYSITMGDTTYPPEEMERGAQSAATEIMKAITETDGHPHRGLFTAPQALTHAGQIPAHFGSIGVPRITPFSGAGYVIVGKRKSIEEISAYRHNPNNFYSATAHNAAVGTSHSKLAGFYAIDGETVYFTGFSAVSDLANFVEADYTLIPDMYYPTAIALAIALLKKDGDVSDIFDYYARIGQINLAMIRNKEMDQPSLKKTVGMRDGGSK